MSKFIAASRQATEMDKTRILLETSIQEVKNDCKGWVEVAAKAKDEAKELQNLVEELKADIVEKETRLDHLQKMNDELSTHELSTLLIKAKGDAVMEFRASKQFTDLLDTNYAAGFEDFHMDTMENFLEIAPSWINLQKLDSYINTYIIYIYIYIYIYWESRLHTRNTNIVHKHGTCFES